MDYHHHARMTWRGREVLCKRAVEGWLRLCAAAAEHSLSRQSATCIVPRSGSGTSASTPAACSQITVSASIACSSAELAGPWTSSIAAHGPIVRKPTERPSAASRPLSGNGPMPAAMKTQPKASNTFNPGPVSTTGIAHMLASNSPHPSPAPASMSTTGRDTTFSR